MTNTPTPDHILTLLELAFVVYTADEFHSNPTFPPLDKVTRLVEAISSKIPGDGVTARNILDHLFEKYNIKDVA